jgi:hypothetical protein
MKSDASPTSNPTAAQLIQDALEQGNYVDRERMAPVYAQLAIAERLHELTIAINEVNRTLAAMTLAGQMDLAVKGDAVRVVGEILQGALNANMVVHEVTS